MDKHTPGPWAAVPRDVGGHTIERSRSELCIAVVPLNRRLAVEAAANARLIAAAPDMLEALRNIANHLTNADYDAKGGLNENGRKVIREVARAAIAKATTP